MQSNMQVTKLIFSHFPHKSTGGIVSRFSTVPGSYLRQERTFATEKDPKELSGTEKNLDMAYYAIITYVK